MKKWGWIALLWAGCLSLTGCCNTCRAYQKLRQPLVGTEWHLIQLQGQPVAALEGQFTLHFSPTGEVTGMGDCNRFMGSYSTADDRSLQIGPLASTRRLCRQSRETELFSTLEQVTHYDMDGPMLLLLNRGRLVALFESVVSPQSGKSEEGGKR